LYEYWNEQVKIRKKRWNNKEIKKFYWKYICKQKVGKKKGGVCYFALMLTLFVLTPFSVLHFRKYN
jgi:hypothetical protein